MAKFFSLSRIIASLQDSATRESLKYSEPSGEIGGVTLRFEPELLDFLDCHAKALGITRSAVVSFILNGVMHQSKAEVTGGVLVQNAQTTVERVQLLMQMHGLDVMSATELLSPFGVTLKTVRDQDALAERLTPEVLQYLEEIFIVSRNWLVGETDAPAARFGVWYKRPYQFARHVTQLAAAGLKPEVIFVRPQGSDLALAYADKEDGGVPQYVMPIVRLTQTLPSGRAFHTYEQWETERWNYHNCRHYLKIIMLWTCRARSPLGVANFGSHLSQDTFKALQYGQILPVTALEKGGLPGGAWYIDDYVTMWDGSKEKEELAIVEESYAKDLGKDFDPHDWKLPDHIKDDTFEFKIRRVMTKGAKG